jgi:CxxC motif-containing protein
LILTERPDYDPVIEAVPRIRELSAYEADALTRKDPAYGEIVCRCESVSEAEIVAAIRRLPVRTSAALLNEMYRLEVKAPVRRGQILLKDFQGTGVDLVAARSFQNKNVTGTKNFSPAY